MPLRIDSSKVTRLFFPYRDRTCPSCGDPQRYDYKSSGRHFYRLDGLFYVDGQIVYCHNGACPLRYKPMHPPEELALAPPGRGYGFDVLALTGQHRFGERLTRLEILNRLAADHPKVVISERQVQNLYDLYGALVSGATLEDPAIIEEIKKNRGMVLCFDGAKPMRDHDSVWFVQDVVSGITLAAQAMTSCTTEALVELLMPIKDFAKRHRVPVIGIVSDAEHVNKAAARRAFPRVRQQFCQLHFITNLAEPLLQEDRKLLVEARKSAREVGKIEKAIKAEVATAKGPTRSQADLLLELCGAIRSVLRHNGKPPFEPPGLLLVERLTGLRRLVQKMRREKGGPIFGRWPSFWPSTMISAPPNGGSGTSMRISGRSSASSAPRARRSRAPSVSSAR